jgi:hypothetical protein
MAAPLSLAALGTGIPYLTKYNGFCRLVKQTGGSFKQCLLFGVPAAAPPRYGKSADIWLSAFGENRKMKAAARQKKVSFLF